MLAFHTRVHGAYLLDIDPIAPDYSTSTKLVSQCFYRKTKIQVITITKSTLHFDAI